MKIWVDADACPVPVREILFRAAERTGIELILVANQSIRKPALKNIKMLQVPKGFDIADNEIVARVEENDLVITSDIPLASEILNKKGYALNPRGELYSTNTIQSHLSMRDFMDTMRGSGIQSGGQAPYSHSDRKSFANALDKLLSSQTKNN